MITEFVLNIIALFSLFTTGFLLGKKYESVDKPKLKRAFRKWAYCFECENTMPTKEKDGHLYCSNCGLHH